MKRQEESDQQFSLTADRPDFNNILRSIEEQFEIIMGRPERVAESCAQLRLLFSHPPVTADIEILLPLLPLLAKRTGPLVFPLFDLLEEMVSSCSAPLFLLQGMISALDKSLVHRALRLSIQLVESGSFVINRDLIDSLAEQADTPGKPLNEPDLLPLLGQLVRYSKTDKQDFPADPVLAFFLNEKQGNIRRLAARILDKTGEPVSADIAEKILGREANSFLVPFLAYTRAGYSDLLSLLPLPGKPPPSLPLLREAHAQVGEVLLREIIADVGWQRINLGIEVRHYVRVSIGDSIPLMLFPAEAALFEQCGNTCPTSNVFLIIAHGTAPIEEPCPEEPMDPATLFRHYNLAHAELLSDFLAVAPLTLDKVRLMLDRMDNIVRDFDALFSSFSEECSVLPDVYGQLKKKIISGLDTYTGHGPLPADLTRLVMMFEDPRSLGEVQTLHGLKRYLHQKGLHLGFRLVLRSRSTNRTIDLLLASPEHILQNKFKGIRYSDFEPESEGDQPVTHIPYPVGVVIEGYSRQLLYGQENFPRTDIFCYGNEVHYYLSFRNHPAFLRINFAPPLQGGMIDLEYFGVSKFELSVHPDLSLNALKRFFQYLEFDIQIEDTRVHARYDKEHAHDLESLCHKVEGIFRLAPYLLDIDWTIGALKLDAEARMKAGEAWAVAFAHWGILPLRYLLTEDRTGIIESIESSPSGKHEIIWRGNGPYRDRLIIRPSKDFYEKLCEKVDHLDIDITPARAEDGHRRFGQIRLERWLLLLLRKAVARGELAETPEGYRRVSNELFQRMHEAEHFAEILHSGDACIQATSALACLIAPLERTLGFRTTGTVNGHEVQFTQLPLRGEDLGIYIMRGEKNNIRLAFYSHGSVLFRRRRSPSDSWEFNGKWNVSEFVTILRRANYPVTGIDPLQGITAEDVRKVRVSLEEAPLSQSQNLIPGERLIKGLSASPGQAVGRVLFETVGKQPEDFDGRILVAVAIRPEDNTFLYHAAGIVSTGGGILSHAGLLATQFHKPAIIISGRWEPQKDGAPLLRYLNIEYELDQKDVFGYRVCIRTRIREREHMLREGDLVVLDASEGWLRVLGQEHDTLALHEALHQFGKASSHLDQTTADQDILTLRGRRLRARHQIEKILTRLTEPILACHAVHEILLGRYMVSRNISGSEKAYLLQMIMDNSNVGKAARDHLLWIIQEINQRFQARLKKAEKHIPVSRTIYEVLNLRLNVLQTKESLEEAESCLREFGFKGIMAEKVCVDTIDDLAEQQFQKLRGQFSCNLKPTNYLKENAQLRHILRDLMRMDMLVNTPDDEKKVIETLLHQLAISDEAVRTKLAQRNIIAPGDGGFELYSFIGWKAANLGEIGKIAGNEWVPPWFAVTDHAFKNILESPIEQILSGDTEIPGHASSLLQSIENILKQPKLNNQQKSSNISYLWDAVILPSQLAEEVITAYRAISEQSASFGKSENSTSEPFVAIRSSSCEEDAEIAARAGEFETFLFIRGEKAVLDYLKRTWSGLWSERAIHNRAVLGTTSAVAGGGVIVQRIVHSRVSGVLQTVNVGRNEMREIVINAGLGLGEGIVSGIVAADQIVVSKDGDPKKEQLHFTYVTGDKKEYVIFNKRAGLGTIRCAAPYHQRLRPALEYVELCELVDKAIQLENAYGYPLDIEFGIEGTKIWILQARPVPAFLSALQDTIQKHPIIGTKRSMST